MVAWSNLARTRTHYVGLLEAYTRFRRQPKKHEFWGELGMMSRHALRHPPHWRTLSAKHRLRLVQLHVDQTRLFNFGVRLRAELSPSGLRPVKAARVTKLLAEQIWASREVIALPWFRLVHLADLKELPADRYVYVAAHRRQLVSPGYYVFGTVETHRTAAEFHKIIVQRLGSDRRARSAPDAFVRASTDQPGWLSTAMSEAHVPAPIHAQQWAPQVDWETDFGPDDVVHWPRYLEAEAERSYRFHARILRRIEAPQTERDRLHSEFELGERLRLAGSNDLDPAELD